MIARAYVQVQDRKRPIVEARSLLHELPRRGIPAEPYSLKQLHRGRIPLERTTLIAGDMDAVPWALKRLGAGSGHMPSYPASLRSELHRVVSGSTVDEVRRRVEREGDALFVKPQTKHKRFTGFVYTSRSDEAGFRGASSRLPVWLSPAVHFVSEHRVYVANGGVVGVTHYTGDTDIEPPAPWVEQLIASLRESGELTAGFGMDVGLLDSGQWALVECNEGFGLGQYPGLSAEAYTDVIVSRWHELMANIDPSRRGAVIDGDAKTV